jgi:protein-disulfide isomerase
MFSLKINISLIVNISLIISCNPNIDNKKKVVAVINDEKVYSEELDKLIIQELYDELNRIYTIKNVTLDDLIKQKLVIQEAKKRNLTSESYLNNYIDSVIEHNSYDSLVIKYRIDKDLTFIHNVSLLSIPSQTYEGRILQNRQLREVIKKELIDSLIHISNIDKYLYPPKSTRLNSLEQQVISYRGNLKSNVTMLLISDFDCGKCIEFHSIYDSIYNEYKDRVKFGYINFSATPTTAIIASEVCNYQNKFWEFYDLVYKGSEFIDSTRAFNIAKELNIDMNKFSNEFNSKELVDKIEKTFTDLHQCGIYATPTIVINNRLLFNSGSYNEIAELLNVELKKYH